MRARHAEIAGAGYAGLAVAAALGRRGWSVRVHERATTLRAFGAGIFLWENGLRVLRALGAYDRVMAAAHEAPKYIVCDAAGERVSEHVFGPSMGTRMITMTRKTLHDALLEAALAAGAEFVTNSEIVVASPRGGLTSASGKLFKADLAIAADGVNSRARDSLELVFSRISLPNGAIRMLVARTADERADADAANVVTHISAEGRRILCAPCDRRELYLAFLSKAESSADAAIPLDKAHWTRLFPRLGRLIGRTGTEGRWDTYQIIKLRRWSAGRVAIVGDACHGLPPALGQGAGLAMMNALSLAANLDRNDEIETALRLWEEAERPLTEHTQDRSHAVLGMAARFSSPEASPWSNESLRAARHIPIGTTQ
jgi:2-polyprenyl-6-methoxyphenol hydroxylase-like FAD-dependent oxidoreductase